MRQALQKNLRMRLRRAEETGEGEARKKFAARFRTASRLRSAQKLWGVFEFRNVMKFCARPEFETNFGFRGKSRTFALYLNLEMYFRILEFRGLYRKHCE